MTTPTKSRVCRAIPLLIAVCLVSFPAQAKYSGGTGEPNDPYQIATAEDLMLLGNSPEDCDKHFKLMADIDLSAFDGKDGRLAFSIIRRFTGVFDGDNHIIRNLAIDMPNRNDVGLIGYLGGNGQICNIGIQDISITGNASVGGLVGVNDGGKLTMCHTTGSVNGYDSIGGLVGDNYGRLIGCYTTVSVSGDWSVGGIVGFNWDGSLTDCHATGVVDGNDSVGGLVGDNYDGGSFVSCYATGLVTGNSSVGGLVGSHGGGSITHCYASGPVSGMSIGGGLVGSLGGGSITCCYASGPVSGMSTGGGLVGSLGGASISCCYASGPVSASDMFGDVGGLVGYNDGGSLTACFWDVEVSGQANDSGGKGLTSSQMKSMSIYRNAGWGGRGWVINDGQDYPRLAWESSRGVPIPEPEPAPLLGSGTTEDPYQVWSASDFTLLSWYVSVLDAQIALMADIDLSGIELYPIGDLGPFAGVFDGNCHLIYNAVIQEPQCLYVGLFGYVGRNAQIRNVGTRDTMITGAYYVGGMVGYNAGATLSACHAIGSVSGRYYVGGLVGKNYYEGSMTACYAKASVVGSKNVGGLVGENWFGLANCYATGSFSGEYDVGGLIGYNTGTLTTCHATGLVDGDEEHIGGLIGTNWGDVTTCYAAGKVEGDRYVGGLVGANYVASLKRCHASGDVTGRGAVGGLVGRNDVGSLDSCYATGSASGWLSAGGLVGSNAGSVTRCYSVGAVTGTGGFFIPGGLVGYNDDGTVIASFWDIDTNGQTNSAGGAGKTTAEMQTASTFLEAGWDFVGETENGTEDFWSIAEGQGYPALVWDYQDHVFRVEISQGWDYEDPDDPDDTKYEFSLNVATDERVEKIVVFTPSGGWFEIPKIPEQEIGVPGGRIQTSWEYDSDICGYDWDHEASFDSPNNLDAYGDGNYTIVAYCDDGRQDQTTIWFGIPGTNEPIAQPVQKPVFTSFAHGAALSSPVTIKWTPCTDPAANLIWVGLDKETYEANYIFPVNATEFDEPLDLIPGRYEAGLGYGVWYQTRNVDGIEVSCDKYTESDYEFTIVP